MKNTSKDKNLIVVKSNHLNDSIPRDLARIMKYYQLLIFGVYLSKLDSNNILTKRVEFTDKELNSILDYNSYTEHKNYITKNISEYEKTVKDMLTIIMVHYKSDKHKTYFQLFSKCDVIKEDLGGYRFILEAHEEALPFIFELKNQFFKYNFNNIVKLKSNTQIRMYEILKQYEYAGSRVLEVEELKTLLGLDTDAYEGRYNNFKVRVLDSCQKALAENTDITFTYEPYKKQSRKIIALKFYIHSNKSKIDTKQISIDSIPPTEYSSYLDEFTQPQITELLTIIEQNMTDFEKIQGILPEAILNKEYIKFNSQVSTTNNINNRFAYFRQILKNKKDI